MDRVGSGVSGGCGLGRTRHPQIYDVGFSGALPGSVMLASNVAGLILALEKPGMFVDQIASLKF